MFSTKGEIMSEIDKLEKGEWFNFGAPEIASRKLNAAKLA